jgi:hypothetical protein
LDEWSAHRKTSIYTGQHKHRINVHIHINIHASNRIRTYDPDIQASQDSSCPRPLAYRDRLLFIVGTSLFLVRIVGVGVQLGPLGTAATDRLIEPAPGDYDDGEICGMIGKGTRITRRKAAPVPLCPPQTPHAART